MLNHLSLHCQPLHIKNLTLSASMGMPGIPLKVDFLFQTYLLSGIFPSTSYYRYLVVKMRCSIEFQNSIFHLFHFNTFHFIAVVEVLFLIHFPLQKHFKGYIFSVFHSLWKCVFQQSSRFQIAIYTAFHRTPWGRFECHLTK